MQRSTAANNRRKTSLTVIKTADEGPVHLNAGQRREAADLAADLRDLTGGSRSPLRRCASPSQRLRSKIGKEREAIGTARIKGLGDLANLTTLANVTTASTMTPMMRPMPARPPATPAAAEGVQGCVQRGVQELASLRRGAVELLTAPTSRNAARAHNVAFVSWGCIHVRVRAYAPVSVFYARACVYSPHPEQEGQGSGDQQRAGARPEIAGFQQRAAAAHTGQHHRCHPFIPTGGGRSDHGLGAHASWKTSNAQSLIPVGGHVFPDSKAAGTAGLTWVLRSAPLYRFSFDLVFSIFRMANAAKSDCPSTSADRQ